MKFTRFKSELLIIMLMEMLDYHGVNVMKATWDAGDKARNVYNRIKSPARRMTGLWVAVAGFKRSRRIRRAG